MKQVESKTKGLLRFPIVAGILTNSNTGERIVCDLENSNHANNIYIPERFHHLIKAGQKVYLTIELNHNGWTEVTSVVPA